MLLMVRHICSSRFSITYQGAVVVVVVVADRVSMYLTMLLLTLQRNRIDCATELTTGTTSQQSSIGFCSLSHRAIARTVRRRPSHASRRILNGQQPGINIRNRPTTSLKLNVLDLNRIRRLLLISLTRWCWCCR